jgi:hypothetical protein
MSATNKTWSNNNPPSCEDADLNGFKLENNNLIVGSGQSLSTSDNQQTQKAVSVYAAGGDFYTDGGAADAYVLSTVGSKVAPPAYFEGMRVRFVPDNTNTGASTINVATLGVLDIHLEGGTIDPAAGQIVGGRETTVVYRAAPSAHFELQAPSGAFRGALVSKTGNQSLTSGAFSYITFDSEEYDTDTIHDNSTNNERLTVPSGVTRIRLHGLVIMNISAATDIDARFSKNDESGTPTILIGMPELRQVADTGRHNYVPLSSAVINVTGGDWFVMQVTHLAGVAQDCLATSTYGSKTYFAMEIVE